MTSAILFQCQVWIGAGTFGPAHRCGALSRSLDEYVRHYQERHDIYRYAPALPLAQRETAQRTDDTTLPYSKLLKGQVEGQAER